MTGHTRPYSRRDFSRAVNCSAVVAWAMVETIISAGIGFSALPWNAILGLPIAFVMVWLVGAPFIYHAMEDNISYLRAALLGLTITSICALIYVGSICLTDFATGATRQDSYIGDTAGQYLVVDGYMTAVGAMQMLEDVIIYLCTGLLIGVVVRVIVGPGEMAEPVAPAVNMQQTN